MDFVRITKDLYATCTIYIVLLLNPLDTIPLPLQVLLPQTNFIILATDRQYIPAQTPTHPP